MEPRNDWRKVVLTTLVAGGWKLDQIQAEPFQTYYSSLSRHAYEADAILIGGYGFGDAHINSVLSNVLRQKETARPPVMVLDHDDQRRQVEDQEPPVHRMLAQRNDGWAYRFRGALNLTWPSNILSTGMAVEQFERNETTRVAVWFGGFETAAGQIDEITRWLGSRK